MKLLHRTLDHVDVPPRPLGSVTADFRGALAAGAVALVCLVVTGSAGNVHSGSLPARLVGVIGAVAFLVLGLVAVRRTGSEVHRVLAARVGPSHAGVVRLLINAAGIVVVALAALDLLAVPIGHLLLGGALTGVIVGIAAQQALGNVFAGLVLLLARPFNVGDAVRLRSGTLGGELVGTITGMGLTYVTLDGDDGPLSLPNSAVLAAGIGPRPDSLAAVTLAERIGQQRR